MLSHFPEVDTIIVDADPKARIDLPAGTLALYASGDADRLLERGFLNIVLRNKDGRNFGIRVDAFRENPVTVTHQEALKKPNASCIMNVSLAGDCVVAHHWDGFVSELDSTTLQLLGQTFTK